MSLGKMAYEQSPIWRRPPKTASATSRIGSRLSCISNPPATGILAVINPGLHGWIRISNPSGSVKIRGLSRHAFAGDGFHEVAEAVELAEGRVDVWRDADALEFFVHNRRREHAVLVEEITPDRRRIYTLDIHVCDRARLPWIERRVETDFRQVFQTVHPVTRQVSESRLLALSADAVVKQQGFAYSEPRRRRVCADLF